ncbi:MAG: hypothetical protein NC084_08905 [Bacteroides sp.]|nr:hypothetical protein [Eubacterium sp.]MCM1418333.1 hypothetical protein [Roseburia sp.]MCM1462815.1 hypothetical protein [Bacteroides sp.]
MEWLVQWWDGLDVFLQVLYCVSIPSTLILVIQTILIIAGFGDGGPDVNVSDTSGFELSDGGVDLGDAGDLGDIGGTDGGGNPSDMGAMHLFTFQGIVTFLCVFSWTGIIAYMASGNLFIALLIGFILGAGAMYGVAKIIQVSAKLAQSGNIVIKNYLGETGTVYIPIPASGNGRGKVNIALGERYVEFDAVTEGEETLSDGTAVRVVDIRAENTLVVEKV